MKLKLKNIFMTILTCTILTPFTNLTSFAAHTGSASDPLPIDSEADLYRMAELTCTVKDGSNGKHFSLNKDIKITLKTNICDQSHPFCGHFHGNGHTIKLLSNHTLFNNIGKEGIIENLTIEGKGHCADTNCGTIRHCTAVPIDVSNGIAENNYGKIEDCQVKGLFMGSGITANNYGEITRCVIVGSEDEFGSYGITACNNKGGKITHCRVSATIRSSSSSSYGVSYTAGLVGINSGLIENCTMDGKILGGGYGVYLVGQSSQDTSEAMIRKSVAGKDASGAYCQKLFGSYSGKVEDCGYEGWDKDDYCSVK